MIVARIWGGLGNQLFCYAAARALALRNKMPLKLDVTSGFARDRYRRQFLLNRFNIRFEPASQFESYSGFSGRARRRMAIAINKRLPWTHRWYIQQDGMSFDSRLLHHQFARDIYLTGYWQSEKYFSDHAATIRDDLQTVVQHSEETTAVAQQMRSVTAIGLHARSYGEVIDGDSCVLSFDYFRKAADVLAERINAPHFFCFSDKPDWLEQKLRLPYPMTIVRCNSARGDDGAPDDLWLLTLCRHFVISNSTFSWWGGWLGGRSDSIVVAPSHWPAGSDVVPASWTVLRTNNRGELA